MAAACGLSPLDLRDRLRSMEPSTDPLTFPVPDWLAPHTEPNIEACSPCSAARPSSCIASTEEIRSSRLTRPLPPCLSAFDRATCEVQRRNKARQWERSPG